MSLREQQSVVLRLVTNAPFRERFFHAPEDAHAEFGLTRDEFAALRRLDAHRVAVAGGGNVYKRFDQIAPAFPMTLAFLDARFPDVRERYAAQHLFVADARRELDAFRAYARELAVAPEERAFLQALADAERRARDLPPVAPARFRHAPTLRPRLAAGALVLDLPVDLVAAAEALAQARPIGSQPPGPNCVHLAWNAGGKVTWERLVPAAAAALAACDGTRTLAALVEAHGDAVDADLARWLTTGVLAPAEDGKGS